MTYALTPGQIAQYHTDGFLFPVNIMETASAARVRAGIEQLERDYPDGTLPRPLNQYFRVNGQVVIPLLSEVARLPAVLDAAQSILGDDLLIWSIELFIKEAGSPKIVSWHQDLTYWGLGETDEELTAWIAFSDVSKASGCMRFVAGSHNERIQPHVDSFDDGNLLSRGQEIAVDVDESAAALVELKPGQMSLHHGRMFHASGPNTSQDRRIGMAIRFVTPNVHQQVGERDYAMLVRGADRQRNWINIAAPSNNFAKADLILYEAILADQSAALSQGADQGLSLYDAAGSETEAQSS